MGAAYYSVGLSPNKAIISADVISGALLTAGIRNQPIDSDAGLDHLYASTNGCSVIAPHRVRIRHEVEAGALIGE